MKTKPFDLEDLEKEIYTSIKKYIRKNYNPKDFADEWIEVFEDFETMDSELGIIEFIIKELKQRIKSACEFYLKYKDKPELLIKEHPEYKSEIGTLRYLEFKEELNFEEEYNTWLFKLAFNFKEEK